MDWQGPRQTATQAADRADSLVSPVGFLWDSDWEAGNRTEPPIDRPSESRGIGSGVLGCFPRRSWG
jgi:hypothetical protein